ncbi:hypothetical protein BDE02_01G311700 [Populus trichocarpa]|nr:hypothetical protein BDE02_01G311700 [Populus trichocarpa]
MPRRKSIARREERITTCSSSSDVDDHELLGADQKHAPEAQTLTHDAGLSSSMSQSQGGSLHSRIYLLASTRPSGRTTFQCLQTLRLLKQ